MTKDKALKLALEALEFVNQTGDTQTFDMCYADKAITAIKEALAQPEQEPDGISLTNIPHPKGVPAPDDLNADALELVELELPDEDEAVAWADCGVINWIAGKQFKRASYLYTTPPQRKPLTDEEIDRMYVSCKYGSVRELARAIEAAHGIKE